MIKDTEKSSSAEIARLIAVPVSGLLGILLLAWIGRPFVDSVIHSDGVVRIDLTLLHWFRSHATDALDAIFVFIAFIGAPGTLVVVSIVGAALIYRRRNWRLLAIWAIAASGSCALSMGIKHLYNRPRPMGAEKFLHDASSSFPSTHALGSTAVLGMVLFAIRNLNNNSGSAIRAANIIVPLLIGSIALSRLYLGVHYLSDVTVGLLVGILWLFVCIVTFRKTDGQLH